MDPAGAFGLAAAAAAGLDAGLAGCWNMSLSSSSVGASLAGAPPDAGPAAGGKTLAGGACWPEAFAPARRASDVCGTVGALNERCFQMRPMQTR